MEKTILTALIFLSVPQVSTAAPPRAAKICEMLLEHNGAGVFVSPAGVAVKPPPSAPSWNSAPDVNQRFKTAIDHIPFGEEMLHESPALAALDWQTNFDLAVSIFKTKNGNIVSVILDMRGLVDIRVGASLNLAQDQNLFSELVVRLQKNGGESLLFGKYTVLHPSPEDGFELWLTRLDGNNRGSRLAMNEILVHLLAN